MFKASVKALFLIDKMPSNKSKAKLSSSLGREPEQSLEATVLRVVEKFLSSETFLQNIVSAITTSVTNRVTEELKTTLQFTAEAVQELQAELKARDKALHDLRRDYDRKMDEIEQYQRRSSLRIFGVPESETDTDKVAIDVAKRIGVSLQVTDIDRSHRVGSPNGGKSRPIIVKFCSYKKRDEVFRSKRYLKNSGMTIREDLTMRRLQVLQAAIEKFQLKNVWSLDGVIFVKIGNLKKRVISMDELSSL